jgi:hypothetical protein
MRKVVVKSVISCLSAGLILSCSGAGTRYGTSESLIKNLINTSLEFVDDASQKLWEGEISGKRVTYFRTLDNSSFKDVVVVTQDRLPTSYRSTEYCDDDGDNSLDKVNIRMYKQGEGWSDIVISSSNQSTLGHANIQYNKLIGKINYKRRGYLSLK